MLTLSSCLQDCVSWVRRLNLYWGHFLYCFGLFSTFSLIFTDMFGGGLKRMLREGREMEKEEKGNLKEKRRFTVLFSIRV